MPHAWLIGGPAGIGKATLAYRAARFVLAHPDPSSPAARAADTLAVDPEHPVFHRVAAQAHPDLLVLERTVGDTGNLRTVITVDEARRTVSFFGSTAGEGGWRVCVVDSADELNPSAANALLKVIEEPPSRSLLLVVSHAPGRLLPTIRSRCRRLTLRALSPSEIARIAAAATGRAEDDADIAAAAQASDGSAGKALALLDGPSLALRWRILGMLAQLPEIDPRALHALGEEISGSDAAPLVLFADTVRDWLSARLTAPDAALPRLARVAEVWENVTHAARDAEIYNLERKPLVFSVFRLLAETAR
jgi:DNA polymerase-3 subunit delta'